MKTLLRSTFISRPEDSADLFLENYQALIDSGLGFEVVEDNVIWQHIRDFVQSHQHVPEVTTLRGHFEHLREDELVDRLETVSSITPRTRGDFIKILEDRVNERKTLQVVQILKDASLIVQTGMFIEDPEKKTKEKKHLIGPQAAIRFVMDHGHDIVTPITGIRLSGEVLGDSDSVMREYDRMEADPLAGIGQFTGITQIDATIRGAKRGELWTHAAFTGGLKSTFAINWAYNQAIFYRHSSTIFSLEMPYPQVRRMFFAIHSAHDKFADVRKGLGLGPCLDYTKIRDGNLDHYSADELAVMSDAQRSGLIQGMINPARPEYKFLRDYVIADLKDETNEYGKVHIEAVDPDKSDYTVADLRSRAEVLYAKDPGIRTLFVDHAGLMAPRKWVSSTTERLNEILRDLKRLSMSFNRGMGIGIVDLFQISREGYKSAEKSDGRYNLTHLSYANEAERSSDIVTTTFVDDDLRSRSLTRFQCLKTRDDEPFTSFFASVLWPCRLIHTCHDVSPEDARAAGEQLDVGSLLDE